MNLINWIYASRVLCKAELVEGADKLLKLQLWTLVKPTGNVQRTVFAGIKTFLFT